MRGWQACPVKLPNVAVAVRRGKAGPVYCVSFRTGEPGGGFRRTLGLLALFVCLMSLMYGAVMLMGGGPVTPGGIVALALGGGLVLLHVLNVWRMRPPFYRNAAIVLDKGRDLLHAGRDSQPLSQLVNLTVEAHPQAEIEQEKEQQRPRRGGHDRIYRSSHCLFGWFGPGGSVPVVLAERYEKPNRNSLREVQAAMQWVLGQP